MDNVTHTLTGLMLSRAGLQRWCPQATALLLLSSNTPDVDVLAALGGALQYLECHRHATHALPAAPLTALLPVLAVRLFSRKQFCWWKAYVLSLAGVLVHALFDAANVYGVRLLAPFENRWRQMDAVHVVDPWVLLVLFLAVAWPALSRLVGSEIGAKSSAGRGWAVFALLFILAYGSMRVVLQGRAVATLDSHTYAGEAPKRIAAWPTMFNPFVWVGYAEGETFHSLHNINLLGAFDPTAGAIYYKPETTPAVLAAQRDDVVRTYLRFAQYPFWRVIPASAPEGGTSIEICDLRFGPPQQPRFVTRVLMDEQYRVLESRFSFGPLRFPVR